ncbi:hypothetical protein AK830_g2144 [Neonectria ditissima]|uniref:GH16 domain-containing protein n=1 Tax=Neonectria ditissima TaxID=78410 RepID=A0A0P7BBW5_9HYPO|nr:hypothetical protein AK830_g2144 [Neonectria ditissima]
MAYELATAYAGESLISGFKFIDYPDPSNGFVSYQNQQDALNQSLYSVDPITNVVRLGVDSTNKYALNEGRPSLRLESKESFNRGLFIADFLHMPPSQCGVWPAFWVFGQDWPEGGELDIIEGANLAYTNIISAHTADGCRLTQSDDDLFTGECRNLDCAIGDANTGCGYNPPASDTSSYGDGFNAVDGGVYAMQWNLDFLRVWHFPRGSIPADIPAKQPDPTGWGLPQAIFGGSNCDVQSFFNDMNIVININFCGDYGDATWKNYETCTKLADSCDAYVANNPEAFKNAYWDINYIEVYEYPNDGTVGLEPLPIDTGGIGIDPVPTDDATTTDITSIIITTPAPSNGTQVFTTPGMTTDPTTTTTMTSESTMFVTVPGTNGSTSPVVVPVETGAPAANNPNKIGDYSYLGCFGSSSSFPTFDLTEESENMTLEKCIDVCNGATYAGTFEGKCYCADGLDADTRAVPDESDCDHVCPGDEDEFCGGLVEGFRSNSTIRRRFQRRDAPNYYLLTVYGDVGANEPDVPPAMRPPVTSGSEPVTGPTSGPTNGASSVSEPLTGASASSLAESPGLNSVGELTTTVTYTIPCPTNLHSLMAKEFVTVVEDCGCDEQPEIAMETKVVACDRCGPAGENNIAVTMPVAVASTTAKHADDEGSGSQENVHDSDQETGQGSQQGSSQSSEQGSEQNSEQQSSQESGQKSGQQSSQHSGQKPGQVSNVTSPKATPAATLPATSPATGTPSPELQVLVSGSGWKQAKISIALTTVLAVIFATLL